MWCRYVATELPIRYRKLVTKTSRCYAVVAALWTAGLITFTFPLMTNSKSIFYYNANQQMCALHWQYKAFAVMVCIFIPILSGAVLIFTAVRISASLRHRQTAQGRDHHTSSQTPTNNQRPGKHSSADSNRPRTVKILVYTSVAFFVCWTPYVVVYLTQVFVNSFQPPSAVEFAVMWLANTNSAVNVFIYSSTNRQFRRQFLLLASRFCCSRLSCALFSSSCSLVLTFVSIPVRHRREY